MIRDVHPGSESRILILIFYPSRIPGSKKHRIPDPALLVTSMVYAFYIPGHPVEYELVEGLVGDLDRHAHQERLTEQAGRRIVAVGLPLTHVHRNHHLRIQHV
jgi:hypothetical protein